ncbi:hypothetical protein [Ramlibacter alkalitolerans]|uniref:Uncharacterized protein n=1 Tax=Ramlibacter alkalitolerans TaxID=2039631 RepID=A0ABS1JTX6_9BURK|nr:hypothetical protein [Ramlibacter alkalitolerans]MBL0427678.1 hypothetical protein [Ramlibacter alkalitolerans]
MKLSESVRPLSPFRRRALCKSGLAFGLAVAIPCIAPLLPLPDCQQGLVPALGSVLTVASAAAAMGWWGMRNLEFALAVRFPPA